MSTTINYWIGTEPKKENIRLSLVAAVELAKRDVLEKLIEQLETNGRRIFCVIDELPLVSTREKVESRIEGNCVVLKRLNEFRLKYGVEFVCNVVVSKQSRNRREALNELREYAPIEYFNGQLAFFK